LTRRGTNSLWRQNLLHGGSDSIQLSHIHTSAVFNKTSNKHVAYMANRTRWNVNVVHTESTNGNEELTWRMVQSCTQAFQRIGNPVRTALLRRWAGGQVSSLPRTGTVSSNCPVGSTGRHNQDSWL